MMKELRCTEVIGFDIRRITQNKQRVMTWNGHSSFPVASRVDSRCWDSLVPKEQLEIQLSFTRSLSRVVQYAKRNIDEPFEIIACSTESWSQFRRNMSECWNQPNDTLRMIKRPNPKAISLSWEFIGYDIVDCGFGAADWSDPVFDSPWNPMNKLETDYEIAKSLEQEFDSRNVGERKYFTVALFSVGRFGCEQGQSD